MKYFLVLLIYGGSTSTPSLTVIPEPFQSYQACTESGMKWNKNRIDRYYDCIEHPLHLEGMQ